MIGAASATPALPAQASAPATDGAPQDATAASPGDARKAGHAGAANGGGGAANAHAPHDADTAGDDRRFARLLAPGTTAEAPVATPQPTPPAREQDTSDAPPAELPDQLLGLFALLVPNAPAPAGPAAVAPAAGAQADGATVLATPLPAGAQMPATTARADAGAALAPLAGQAQAAGAAAARAEATAPLAMPLPAGLAPAGDEAAGADAFTRLVAEAATGRDGPQADPLAAQSLPPAASATSAAARAAVPPHAPLSQPADPGAGYGDDFGKGVLWMTDKALGHAQLRVTPDHLGPIDVRLQLDGARVHAEFSSAQPDVRQALEASLPRLREMLGQHGLELAQADVGQRQHDPRPRPATGRDAGGPEAGADTQPIALPPRRLARGLLDEYA
ncbi:MAG TPA: flagellar hook-length control protein FliK [Xanthomonadaceae bacterium]|nr:flagellar hook-length control protein FliK [Xanthomonadaceae bacterium]